MNQPDAHDLPLFPPAGTAVAVSFGFYRHVGIVSDRMLDGVPLVISASKRRGLTAEEPWAEFCGGRAVTTLAIETELPAVEVLARARSCLGRRWDLFFWNCEHMVRFAYGLPHQSPQVRKWARRAAAAIAVAMGYRTARRSRA